MRNTLIRTQFSVSNCEFQEHLWAKVHLPRNQNLLVCCIYRSPSGDKAASTALLCDLFHKVNVLNFSHILIAGDFNYGQILWDDCTVDNSLNLNSHSAEEFLLAALFTNIIQNRLVSDLANVHLDWI